MANGMLIDPAKQMAALRASANAQPKSPGFSSPWEQMAFQAGGMLGGMAGNQALIAPKVQQVQQQAATQAKELESAMSAEKPLDRYRAAEQLFATRGDTKNAEKFAKLAQAQEKTELGEEWRDVKAGQWAADFSRKLENSQFDHEYKKALIKSSAKNKDTRTSNQKLLDDTIKFQQQLETEQDPIKRASLESVLAKMKGNQNPKLIPTGTEFKQTTAALPKLTSSKGDTPFEGLGKKEAASVAAILAPDVKQILNDNPGMKVDEARTKAVDNWMEANPQGTSFIDDIKNFFGGLAESVSSKAPVVKSAPVATDASGRQVYQEGGQYVYEDGTPYKG